MIQNTSETRESLLNYTIPQLEAIVQAMVDNNNHDENDKPLEGKDAVNELKRIGLLG